MGPRCSARPVRPASTGSTGCRTTCPAWSAATAARSIDVELWRLPASEVGGLLAGVNAPLGFGRVRLDDGREVTGFLCEAYAVAGAEDITASGGWRAYRKSLGR